MSQATATQPMGLNLETQAASTPKSQLLKSFNIFKVMQPQELLREYTRKVTTGEVPEKNVSVTDDSQAFFGVYKEQEYSRDVKTELSVSAGIEGKYGVFSASLQTDYSKSDHSTSTSFYSSYTARVAIGTIAFDGSNEAILNLLDPAMVTELKAINSLAKAKTFTDKWGTHLVTSVSTGGMLFVSIAAETKTKEETEKLSVKLNAEYNGAVSLSTAASVITESAKTQTSKSFVQKVVALGGLATKAALIDGKDKATIQNWIDSCSGDTAYRVNGSIEIYSLVDSEAGRILKQYLTLAMLAHSIKNPTIFVKEKGITAYQTNTITAPGINSENYKIIGGGATTSEGSSSYLNGCYPQISGSRPTGWHAVSHDMYHPADPRDIIAAYAIGIYDPEDILQVTVVVQNGTNPRIGGDTATARVGNDYILTCGGLNCTVKTGYGKIIISSYYTDDNKGWVGDCSDYVSASTDTTLTVYAVGVKSKDPNLTIEGTYVTGPVTRSQHGRNTAAAPTAVCGGGIKVSENQGMGNLVQRNYPSTPTTWMGTNDDLAGNISPANSRAYAVSLNAKVKI